MKLHAFDAPQHGAGVVFKNAALSGRGGRAPHVLGRHKFLGQGRQFSLPEGVFHQARPAQSGVMRETYKVFYYYY